MALGWHLPHRGSQGRLLRQGKLLKRVLSTSWHAGALETRNRIIEASGYEVTTTREPQLFLKLLQEQHFDALVLGDSIDLDVRVALMLEAKRLKPQIPVLVFYRSFAEAQRLSPADYRVEALGPTERFVEALHAALGD